MDIEVGKQYDVDHARKGKFRLLVTSVDDEWVAGTVVGTAVKGNTKEWEPGETITLRRPYLTTCTLVQ